MRTKTPVIGIAWCGTANRVVVKGSLDPSQNINPCFPLIQA